MAPCAAWDCINSHHFHRSISKQHITQVLWTLAHWKALLIFWEQLISLVFSSHIKYRVNYLPPDRMQNLGRSSNWYDCNKMLKIPSEKQPERESVLLISCISFLLTVTLPTSFCSTGNCAHFHKGGWWYNACAHSNLNGVWYRGGHYRSKYQDGIFWAEYRGGSYSLKAVQMMIRPIDWGGKSHSAQAIKYKLIGAWVTEK